MKNIKKKTSIKKKTIAPRCPKCGYRESIKSGQVQGEQRWKCKSCAYQYTRIAPRGRPLWQKSLVVFLYSYGVSMHAIARIFHVQPSTVLKWVRTHGTQAYPTPEGALRIMELKDMPKLLKQAGQDANMLCIAINDATFKKGTGITISRR